MGAKAQISWKARTVEGLKREVRAQRVGGEWRFFARAKRYDQWQPLARPPLEDWLELLDAVQQLSNEGQQGLYEGRPLFGPNLGKLHLHASQCTNTTADQLR